MDTPKVTTDDSRTASAVAPVATAGAGMHYGESLVVDVERGALVVRIGSAVLAHAVRFAEWANPWDDTRRNYIRTFAITDAAGFARDVCHAMLSEREDGSTPLSDFLDAMTQAALDDGSNHCEYDQCIEHGAASPQELWIAALSPAVGRESTADDGREANPAPQIQLLIDLLQDCESYFDDHADVRDGSEGEPIANREMSLLSQIRAVLAQVQK